MGTGASRYFNRSQVLTWECAYKFYLYHRCQGNTGGGDWSWLSGKKFPPPLSTVISWQHVAFIAALLQQPLFLEEVARFIQIPARCKYSEDTVGLALSPGLPSEMSLPPAHGCGLQPPVASSLSLIALLPNAGLTSCSPICVTPVLKKSKSPLCFNGKDSASAVGRANCEKGVKPRFESRSVVSHPPRPQRVP